MKYINIFGVNKAIIYVVLHRSWGAVSGVVTLLLISTFLTAEEQGYFYTFSSIIAIQIIFELGFGVVLTQFCSSEMVKLYIHQNKLAGDEVALSRLLSLIRFSNKWSFCISILIILIITPIGYFFFSSEDNTSTNKVFWFYPWITLVVVSGFTIFITPLIAIADGCGYIEQTSKVKFLQAMFSSLIVWCCLISDNGLFAIVALPLSQCVFGFIWLKIKFSKIIIQAYRCKGRDVISWKNEILPMQWRIGVSWVCGYFIFQLFNPVAFKFFGAEFAGKLGISITVINLAMMLSLAWITTRMPEFGRLASEGKDKELSLRFKTAFIQSFSMLSLSIFCCVLALNIFEYLDINIGNRFLQLDMFILLSLAVLGNHIVACQASYIRIRKSEVHLTNAIITAFFMIIMLLSVALFFSKEFMVISYLIIVWCICVPHSTYIVYKYLKKRSLRLRYMI